MDKLLIGKIGELLLNKGQSIVIISHTNPDGDAIGSCLALFGALELNGYTQVSVIIPNSDPVFLHWIPWHDNIINATLSPDLADLRIRQATIIFCLDFNQLSRIDQLEKSVHSSAGIKILIDHHPDPSDVYDYCLSYTHVSSTAELIYEFLLELNMLGKLNPAFAQCIYTGIVTDTGSFSYASNYPRTYEIMASLMQTGIDGEQIHRLIYSTYSVNRMRLLGYCLSEKLVVIPEKATAFICLSRKELHRFNHQIGDTEGIVNYALSLKDIHFAALFTENKDYIKISFRSSGKVNVNDFAKNHFSGGGHQNASGGKSFENMQETVMKFEKLVYGFPDYDGSF